jgi:hypothetical protein
MPRVHRTTDPVAPSAVVTSWLWSAAAVALVLVAATLGQAVGALLGGCSWIGVSIPLHRPVWALLDQPTLDFARRTAALGYWFGAVGTAAAIGGLAVAVVPRPRTFAAEIAMVQTAWLATVVGVAWMPLLDLEDGHPARWLRLHSLPEELLVLAPVAAAALAIVPTLRLLAMARAGRAHLGRASRLGVIFVHLLLPAATTLAVASVMAPRLPAVALIGASGPAAAALAVAWFGFPPAHPWLLEPPGAGSIFRAIAVAAVGLAVVWLTGRPVANGDAVGIVWRTPTARNNIRPWIEPTAVAGASARPIPYPLESRLRSSRPARDLSPAIGDPRIRKTTAVPGGSPRYESIPFRRFRLAPDDQSAAAAVERRHP